MERIDIITTIGRDFLTTTGGELGEFNYKTAFSNNGIPFPVISTVEGNRDYQSLDIRFVKNRITVLVETKVDFTLNLNSAIEQLEAYVKYEKQLTGNSVIAILANTIDDRIMVWRGAVSDTNYMDDEDKLRTIDEYIDFYTSKTNNKEKVMQNTYKLNELLHFHGISEKLRSQFVGTCLLALKNGLEVTPKTSASQIRAGIKEVLGDLLTDDINKAGKLALLDNKVLLSQNIRDLTKENLREILTFIDLNILPFINDKSTAGQDLLNLFFITFNKYVGKDDKNQAFTPDHITDFMSKITGVNKNSVIMDPCCGSGSFLVRAMTQALDDCSTAEEQDNIKKNQVYGIEYDEGIYGLATTNMLIHGDGNSNVINGSCFDYKSWIEEAKPNVILMNPPYNAQRKHMPKEFVNTWSAKQKEDPSKGLYFVKYMCDLLNSQKIKATVAVLLPVACAIGNNKEIKKLKQELLKENTLDAVFSLPNEIFYPGASASACCMVIKVGTKHSNVMNLPTFFGYYKDDGFRKKKNLGRIEQMDENGESLWSNIQSDWIETYRNRVTVDGFSAVNQVTGNDEWLAEAYMKTDFSQITASDFQITVNEYLSYLVRTGETYES